MSACRYRHPKRDVEIRIDDETPQSDTPIMLRVGSGVVELSIVDALEMQRGLKLAIVDAERWLDGEVSAGLRQQGQSIEAMLEDRRASTAAVAEHERKQWAEQDAANTEYDAGEGDSNPPGS